MFFQKKEVVIDKLPLLDKKNILINSKAAPKEQIICQLGQMLHDTGYVNEDYIDGMLEREQSFNTYIGNGIAIPHGVSEAKKNIITSGIAVMVFPEGTEWSGNVAKLVVGIAGLGDEHLEILANIAENLATVEAMEKLVNSNSVDVIYQMFIGEAE